MWKKIEFAIVLLLLAVLIMMSNHLEEMVSSGRVTGRNPCIVLDDAAGCGQYPSEQLSGCADPRGAGLLLFAFGRGKANGRSDAESAAEGR